MNTRNFSKAVEAVSPVVATLLLVLVAAGAAIGFGVFLNGFQKKTQDNVSSDQAQTVLTIGGSSTVWEFSRAAIPGFEAAHPTIDVVLEEGGSGAGKQAVCRGLVDIGSSSSPFAATGGAFQTLDVCPDFNGDGVKDVGGDMKIHTIAYDGVVMTTPLASFTAQTCSGDFAFSKEMIKELYNVNGKTPAGTHSVSTIAGLDITGTGFYTWDDIDAAEVGTGVAGQTTCTGTDAIVLGSRSDPGGTEDGFCKGIGLTCVTGTNQLDDGVYNNVNGQNGNQGIESWLLLGDDRLSFIGYGHVNGLSTFKVAEYQGFAISPTAVKNAANLATGATCTPSATFYCNLSRPLIYVTAGEPSSVEQLYLDWVLGTANNQAFAKASGYVHLFA